MPSGISCDGTPVAEETVALDGTSAESPGVSPSSARSLFVLSPGGYTVCMTPITSSGTASSACARSQSAVTVMAGETTSLTLTSQCQGSSTGGIAVTGGLNDPPQIVDVNIDTSDASPCQQARLGVRAVDPNGDWPLVAEWSVTGPGSVAFSSDARYELQPTYKQVVFYADAPGDYQVTVTVSDPQGAATSLSLPVHVSESSLTGDTCILTPTRDTYLRTDMDIRRNDNYGCNPFLEIGTSRGGGGKPEGSPDAMRIMVHFPILQVAPKYMNRLESAILEMTVLGYEQGGDNSPYTLDVHASYGPMRWAEGNGIENEAAGQKLFEAPMSCVGVDEDEYGVTWENWALNEHFYPDIASRAIVDPTTQGKGTVIRWDITSLVRDWLDLERPDAGVVIVDTTSTGLNRGIRFGSREQIFGFPPEYTAAGPRLLLKMAP